MSFPFSMHRSVPALLASLLLGAASIAQSNAIPGLDVGLSQLGPIQALGRTLEPFPEATNGIALLTTACNLGTVTVPWRDGDSTTPMGDDHPWIVFLVTRYDGQRMVQVSDRSFAKAGFNVFAGNVCGQCSSCPGGTCNFLAPGCSDTYSVSTNGNNYFLAPPDEIEPFEVTWDPYGTHFDRGEPPVAPPFDTDGIRSLTQGMVNALGPVAHRVRVHDREFDHPGATFWFQGYYVVQGEPEAARANNLGTRQVVPTWNGTKWGLAASGSLALGSVLQRWPGAMVTSATNGTSDGRVFVAASVTGPTGGLFHYEYALHNRDNARAVRAFRLPLCAAAQLSGFEFRDIDGDPATDWTLARVGDELVVSTTSDPLRWNTLYNIAFDSDALPGPGAALLEAFDAGPGAPSFAVATVVPGVMTLALVALDGAAPGARPLPLGVDPSWFGGLDLSSAQALLGVELPFPPAWGGLTAGAEALGALAEGTLVLPLGGRSLGSGAQLGTVLICPRREATPIRK